MITSTLVSTPLPAVETTNLDQPAHSAYNIFFILEQNADTEEDHIYARILGYLILNAPTLDAQVEVIKAVHSCFQDERQLLELGRCFMLWFILPFKRSRGCTPTPSEHSSNLESNTLEESLKAKIVAPPTDHQTAKSQALHRDGYKCPVTGMYDLTVVDMQLVDCDMVIAEDCHGIVNTKLAHILPQSTSFTHTSPPTKDHDVLVSVVLKSFGYDIEKMNSPKVHSLYNVMTMQHDIHNAFEQLKLWFESTEKENCYHVKGIYPLPACSKVTFVSPDPLTLPYPSSQFLALHAACAKVAHLSGACEYIDELDHDLDDL